MNRYFQQEFPSLQAAGDPEKAKEKDAADDNYGPGPSLRPQSNYFFISMHTQNFS